VHLISRPYVLDPHHDGGVELGIVVEGGVATWYLTGVADPYTLVDEAEARSDVFGVRPYRNEVSCSACGKTTISSSRRSQPSSRVPPTLSAATSSPS
jgi:hypothetical protein